jgi:hypothetical protein
MKAIYFYLYYSLFQLFKLIKRNFPIDHYLASSFLAVLFSFNIISLLILFGVFQWIYFKMPLLLPIIIIFSLSYYLHNKYFIISNRYKVIIDSYDLKKIPKVRIIFIGVIYIIITFLSFIIVNNINDK